MSPTRIPRVNVVGLPFASFAVTTTRCVPDLVPEGNLYVPLTVPSVPTTAEPNCVGVENNHTSTIDPGLKPPTLILISSPAAKRMLPSLSSGDLFPALSRPDNVALSEPAVTTI